MNLCEAHYRLQVMLDYYRQYNDVNGACCYVIGPDDYEQYHPERKIK